MHPLITVLFWSSQLKITAFGVCFISKKPTLKQITHTYINKSCVGWLNTSYYNADSQCPNSEPGVMCTIDLANSAVFLGWFTLTNNLLSVFSPWDPVSAEKRP